MTWRSWRERARGRRGNLPSASSLARKAALTLGVVLIKNLRIDEMTIDNRIDWQAEQDRFMALVYTRCERAARRAFKRWHERKKDDAVQEACSKMWYSWRCCLEKGKDPAGMIGPLIHWSIMHVRYDRRIAGRPRNLDIQDFRAGMTQHLLDGRGMLQPHDRTDRINGFLDWTGQARTDDPAELVAALEGAGLSAATYAA